MKRKRNSFFSKNYRGQIWVETVIYTLIALVMIGLVLAFARPKIQELQDKTIIDQSITMMKEIDSTILNLGGQGNRRIIELGIKKGSLTLDGSRNKLFFEIESQFEYSEPGRPISDGNLTIYTEKIGSANFVNITKDYSYAYDVRFEGLDEQKILTKSSVAYKLSITNDGIENTKTIINMELI